MPKIKLKRTQIKQHENPLIGLVTTRKEYYLSKLGIISNAVYKSNNIALIDRFETRVNRIYKTFSGNLEKRLKSFNPKKTQKESLLKPLSQERYNKLRNKGKTHEEILSGKDGLKYLPQVYAMAYANTRKTKN